MTTIPASDKFQSTHPVRGGTPGNQVYVGAPGISIHPPREGWDIRKHHTTNGGNISIHPPREGWDVCGACPSPAGSDFNPPTP